MSAVALRLLRRIPSALLIVAITSIALPSWAVPPSARAFESRLWAPCCYEGTLDIHESDLARTLRHEIEARIEKGESEPSIQADLVARYGEKVIAARSAGPSERMGLIIAAFIVSAGVVLALSFRRRVRKTAIIGETPSAPGARADDELERRLDAELAELDG